MTVRILTGDCRDVLRALPDQFFDCVVCSPPYWGLRDYNVEGQIGLEATLGEHLDELIKVFREVRRVLKTHGTVWLNYGDCYAAAPNGKSAAEYKADGSDDRTFRDKPFSTVGPIYDPNYSKLPRGQFQAGDRQSRVESRGRVVAGGFLKSKDLCMIPNRLAIALQDDGWYVRSEIIWHKPNPMPESVYDRPTSAHEKVWLLSKSEDYFYNHEAIREPVTGTARPRAEASDGPNKGVGRRLDRGKSTYGRQTLGEAIPEAERRPAKVKIPGGWDVEPGAHGKINRSGRTEAKYTTRDAAGLKTSERFGREAGWRDRELEDAPVSRSGNKVRKLRKDSGGFSGRNSDQGYGFPWEGSTRNARNVWTIAPKPFKDAHFATFPPELAERCIKAGAPSSTCTLCGEAKDAADCGGMCSSLPRTPGRVLDPFGGAGTVGLVAKQFGLECTLIELNPEYAELARRRIFGDVAEVA